MKLLKKMAQATTAVWAQFPWDRLAESEQDNALHEARAVVRCFLNETEEMPDNEIVCTLHGIASTELPGDTV